MITGDKYVGSSVDIPRRWNQHRRRLRKGTHHSAHLQNAWNKYGEKAFVFTVVGYCGKVELLRFEQRAIDTNAHAYNMAKDAQAPTRGRHRTPETRAKLSAAHLGKRISAETRAKMSTAQRARPPASAETRAKISAAKLGKHFSRSRRDNMGRVRAALSDDQVRGIRAAVMAGFSQGDVARLLGTDKRTINRIHTRTTYKWVA
jgi:group I intron endonuclease